MARCPFAKWVPLRRADAKEDCDKDQIILHTMCGHMGGTRSTFENGSADSTFLVALDGEIHQLMESQKAANANGSSNKRAISIETEDGSGNDKIVNHTPWTPEQILALVKLMRWAGKAHGIPLVRMPDPHSPGIGYHMMFRDRFPTKNPWTKFADKLCPGERRSLQFDAVLVPELAPYKLTLDGEQPAAQGLSLASGMHPAVGLLGTRAAPAMSLESPAMTAYRLAPATVFTRDRHNNLVGPRPYIPATTPRKSDPKKTRKR